MIFYYGARQLERASRQAPLFKAGVVCWSKSFFDLTERKMANFTAARQRIPVKLFFDSGAYSAWAKGEEIDLKAYIAYIKKHESEFEHYVNLDVIPGKPGQRATAEQVEASAKASYRNLQRMQKAGLSPIPVYHQGEDKKWLQRLRDDGHEYIGISPATEANTAEIIAWLDGLFAEITDDKGRALFKTHGFGVASFAVMKRYPWYTCDATSWALTAGFGSIFVPASKAGRFDYAAVPTKVTLSPVSRKNGVPVDHISTWGPLLQSYVRRYIEDDCQLSYDDVCNDWQLRAFCNIYFTQRFAAAIGDVRFNRKRVQRSFL